MKKDEIKEEQETSYEKTSIKDFRFTIIFFIILIIAAIAVPKVADYVKHLKEEGFFDNLFKKDENPIDNPEPKKKDDEEALGDNTGASKPILDDGMIPVRYNYVKNVWVKADKENPARNAWYNYENKEWANAIIVKENGTKTRKYYEKAKADTEIKTEDILGFFVWIPRFKYDTIKNTGLQEINIEFESASTSKSTGPNSITHPAFTFDKELEGFWIGKFETTGSANSMTILPNQPTITNQTLKYMYDGIQYMIGNGYGLTDKTDIKLIKNTEWGAVTYLANSKYGRCKKNTCENIEVYNNDYSSQSGLLTSTTGNITGVYAMSGGALEYTMANNNNTIGQSGFDENFMLNNKKYYDYYQDGSTDNYERAIQGDATKELSPIQNFRSSWNNAVAIAPDKTNPWIVRGQDNNIYSFGSATGGANPNIGFRITLTNK